MNKNELDLSKIHSMIMRFAGSSDDAWELLATAFLTLDRSRTLSEQAAYLVFKARKIQLDEISRRCSYVSFGELDGNTDDGLDSSSLMDIITAVKDERSLSSVITGLLSAYRGRYRKELVTYVLYVANSKTYDTGTRMCIESVRRCLRKFGFTAASSAARDIYEFLSYAYA